MICFFAALVSLRLVLILSENIPKDFFEEEEEEEDYKLEPPSRRVIRGDVSTDMDT